MCSTSSLPPLPMRVASMFHTLNMSEGSRVTLALSSLPQGWLDLHDSVSGLPINCPGWWQREKLKCKRKRDQHACWQLSFCASWCRQDIGSLYDPPPGPRFEGPSVDLNNPVCRGIKSCIYFGKYPKTRCRTSHKMQFNHAILTIILPCL